MSRPTITIDDFSAGMTPDSTMQTRSGGFFIQELDLYSEPGLLQAELELKDTDDSSIDKFIEAFGIYNQGGTEYLLAVGGDKIWKSTGGAWSTAMGGQTFAGSQHDVGGVGMTAFAGKFYITGGNHLLTQLDGDPNDAGSYNKTFKGLGSTGNHHPLAVFNGKLCVGDGSAIKTLDSDHTTWTTDALTLEGSHEIVCLEPIGELLAIGTRQKTSVDNYQYGEADFTKVYFWDGSSDASTRIVDVNVPDGVLAMRNIGNRLYIITKKFFHPIGLNIHLWNGSEFEVIETIEMQDTTADEEVRIYSNAIEEFNGNILIGTSAISHTSNTQKNGVYGLVRNDATQPYSLSMLYRAEAADTAAKLASTKIGALKVYEGKLFAGINIDSAGTFHVGSVARGNDRKTGGVFETQIYESPAKYGTQFKGVRLVAEPMPASTSVDVKYKLDDAASWTSLGTIDSTNQGETYHGPYSRWKTIQLQLTFNTNSTDTPKVKRIEIY